MVSSVEEWPGSRAGDMVCMVKGLCMRLSLSQLDFGSAVSYEKAHKSPEVLLV